MNVMIGFSLSLETFPNPLKNCGYSIELVEPFFEKIGTPDLFFNSSKGGLICECKTNQKEDSEEPVGEIEKIKKYEQIKIIHLSQKGVNITYNDERIDLILAIASKKDYKNYLQDKKINYPIISFNLDGISSYVEKK